MLKNIKKIRLRFIAVVLGLIGAVSVFASSLDVKARLDSVNLLMGKTTVLRLEVVQDEGVAGKFPLLSEMAKDGIIPLCGDSVELRSSFKQDTVDLGSGRIQVNYAIQVQSFDSGTYRLPEFLYVTKTDSVRSNRVTLKVYPLDVKADDEIAPFAPVQEPEGKSIFDSIPDWLYDWWWLILAILILCGLLCWMIFKKKGNPVMMIRKPKPMPSPYEVAVAALKELKERKLWEQGMEKEYFTRLTDILRVYLEKRFHINAMEMTSRQIMDTLRENNEIRDKRGYVRQILDIADFVKFAKVRPLPADNIAAYDNALKFVEETRPLVPAEVAMKNDETGGGAEALSTEKKGGEK